LGNTSIASHIPNLCTSWWWVARFWPGCFTPV